MDEDYKEFNEEKKAPSNLALSILEKCREEMRGSAKKEGKHITEVDKVRIGELIECMNQAFSNDDDDTIETTLNELNCALTFCASEVSTLAFSNEFGDVLKKLVTRYFGSPQIMQTLRIIGNLMIGNSEIIKFFFENLSGTIVGDILTHKEDDDNEIFLWELRIIGQFVCYDYDKEEEIEIETLLDILNCAKFKDEDIITEAAHLIVSIVMKYDYQNYIYQIFEISKCMLEKFDIGDTGYKLLVWASYRIIYNTTSSRIINRLSITNATNVFGKIFDDVVIGKKIDSIDPELLKTTLMLLDVLTEGSDQEQCLFFLMKFNPYNIFAALHHDDPTVSYLSLKTLKNFLVKAPEEFKLFIENIGLYDIIHMEGTFKQKKEVLNLLAAMYSVFRKDFTDEFINLEFMECFSMIMEIEEDSSREVYNYIQTLLDMAVDAKELGIFEKFMDTLGECDIESSIKELEASKSDDLAELVTQFILVVEGESDDDDGD